MKEIMLFESYSDEDDVNSVNSVLKRGTYWANGPEIKEFEDKIAAFTGRKFAISFNSGTSALYAVLLAHGIDSGEVIVPSFTFPATVNSVVAVGAKPVFADIETDSFGLDADDVLSKITSETKAIMPMHFSGGVCRDIEKMRKICDEKRLILIEDNAHSIGAKMAGKLGDSAMLSFCFNKILPTGEGGMIITDSLEVTEKLKLIRSHGRAESKDYVTYGLNLRMPSMVAALGLSQFKKLDFLISKRREIAKFYDENFKSLSGLRIPKSEVYQLYNLIFENGKRDEFIESMNANNIPTRVTYTPVHLYSFFREKYGCKEGDLPVTEEVSKKIITIPLHLNLDSEQLNYIASKIKEFF